MGNKSHVNVFARHDGNGGIDWSMTSNEKKANGNLRYARKNQEDSWEIEFELHDKTGRGLVFPNNPHDALWVKRANDPEDCCKTPSRYAAFTPLRLEQENRVLIVSNSNTTAEDLAFTLRAIPRGKDQSKPANYFDYDPIVENRNGQSDD